MPGMIPGARWPKLSALFKKAALEMSQVYMVTEQPALCTQCSGSSGPLTEGQRGLPGRDDV